MDTTSSFGAWLRRRRRTLDLTRDELALHVGCAAATIKKIEADERRPSKQLAERLAVSLDIPDADRVAFLKAARAELAVDQLAPLPALPLAPPPTHRLPEPRLHPQALRGYVLHEQLGAGGFGAVYRAEQPGVGREVAVKVILPAYANHPDFIRRFEAEAQLVARLEHPHIVPLYDYWREPSGAYLVMRYIRGGSLHAALQDGPWPVERSSQLLTQIGAALAFAHRHGVVHRDLKPANVLLDEDGHAYLADFGIAKDVHSTTPADQTQPSVVVGSPEYLSPEQIRDETVTPQTDMYSLGVLLVELLTGAHPFADFAPAERLERQLHTPLPPLAERRPDLPTALNDVIQRATAKRPADRFPDILNMVIAWQQALAPDGAAVPAPATPTEIAPRITDMGALSSASAAAVVRSTVTEYAVAENPYKGLRAFGAADAADFFGRTDLTQQLLERLATEDAEARFLAVVGPSGSGKSSVVRAGLIPALRRGGLPGSERWFVVELLPGAHPLEELEAALLRIAVNPPESLLGQLREDTRGLARAVKRVLPADTETDLVLVIDQFEELFTLTEDEVVRTHFLDSLRAAVLDPHSRLRVVVTLRADFYDRPLLYSGFGELMRQRTEVVLPLTPEELEQAIAGPAARVGVAVAPELVAAIGHDVGEQPGTLPLLQYALTELFERRQGRTLTLAAYRETGGVRGALARRADEVYTALDATRQEAARQLFLRLITLGEGIEDTRRRVPQAELMALTKDRNKDHVPRIENQSNKSGSQFSVLGSHPTMDEVIERYGHARLLSFDRDPITRGPTVEVAHEALLREWGQLRAWLDTSRADVRMQRMLAVAATEWATAGREPSYLLSGARLTQFAGWATQTEVALTRDEHAFLETSITEHTQREAAEQARQKRELETAQQLAATEQRRADEQSRAAARLRRRAIWLASALLVAFVAAVAAGIFAQNARSNLARSERERLAAEATVALDEGESGNLPALLALRSLHSGYTPQADAALLRALAHGVTLQHFVGHGDWVYGVAYSPDGKYVLTGSDDQTARLWNAQTGQEVRQFKGHTDGVRAVAYSPDGKHVLTGSWDTTAQLWDAQTGQEVRQFKGHTGAVLSVAFSPDGKTMLTGSYDQSARLWDVATGQKLRIFCCHAGAVESVAFSPDGKTVLTSSDDRIARLWDIATGQQLRDFRGHADVVTGVAFSPDGKMVLTGSADKTGRLWDPQTGREVHQFQGHTGGVNSVAFSPDGKYVLTGSADRTVRLWDARTGQEVQQFIGHTDIVWSVAFSPDGNMVLTGSRDNTARLWAARVEPEPRIFAGHTDRVTGVAFSPDGKYILTGSGEGDQTARLWDAQTGQEVRQFKGHTDYVSAVAFSVDGKYVLTGSWDYTAGVWDSMTGQRLRSVYAGIDCPVHCGLSDVAFAPDGKTILTSNAGGAHLWDAQTGRQLQVFSGHIVVFGVAFSPDGKYVLTGSGDQTARLWDTHIGQELRQFQGHTGWVNSVAFSPDGKYVLTGSGDQTARLWDTQTGQQLRVFSGHTGAVNGVAFSPDGKYVLTGSGDQTARLWDTQTGQQLRVFSGHTGAVNGVAFAPDGKTVLTGSTDTTARLWRVDGQEVIQLICTVLPRDLTAEERATYSIADNAPSCPKQ